MHVAGLDCEAFGDDADYEPDAASNPVIVVEVISPSTQSIDTGAKLIDYFGVPSIQHYLIIRAEEVACQRVLATQHGVDALIRSRIRPPPGRSARRAA